MFAGLTVLALTVFALPVAARSDGQSDVAGARQATASFHDLSVANAAGYSVEVADLQQLTCIADPGGAGAMGIHYLNPTLVPELFDASAPASVDASTPELLVYAPSSDGSPKRLVALEYLTIKASGDAQHGGVPPSLFGQTFNQTGANNRFGLPAYYSLHAWIWDPNPTDLFAPWNPRVSCPSSRSTPVPHRTRGPHRPRVRVCRESQATGPAPRGSERLGRQQGPGMRALGVAREEGFRTLNRPAVDSW